MFIGEHILSAGEVCSDYLETKHQSSNTSELGYDKVNGHLVVAEPLHSGTLPGPGTNCLKIHLNFFFFHHIFAVFFY
jgi:hypothetical protein